MSHVAKLCPKCKAEAKKLRSGGGRKNTRSEYGRLQLKKRKAEAE